MRVFPRSISNSNKAAADQVSKRVLFLRASESKDNPNRPEVKGEFCTPDILLPDDKPLHRSNVSTKNLPPPAHILALCSNSSRIFTFSAHLPAIHSSASRAQSSKVARRKFTFSLEL